MQNESFLVLPETELNKGARKVVENNEHKRELLEAIVGIKRKISSEFYADPDKRILPEFYNDRSPEGKQRLQDLKRNKFRKGWFTATMGDIQLAARFLDSPVRDNLLARVKELNREVVATPEVTFVLIAKAEGLVRAALQLLQEKLESLSSN